MDIFSTSYPDPHDEAIAGLNDEFRRSGRGGSIYLTGGVVALGKEKANAVRKAVRDYDDFTEANDPYGWKIDYYDPSLEDITEFADDPTKTTRVLRIMLAEEF